LKVESVRICVGLNRGMLGLWAGQVGAQTVLRPYMNLARRAGVHGV